MAHYQNQYGDATGRSTDEYGNPVNNYYDQRSGTAGQRGTAIPTPTGATGRGHHQGLHRTGSSSSSSSSEDEVVDENGVRRKKGMKEKIKDKIPGVGGHHSSHAQHTSTTTPGGAVSSTEHHHDKKGGFMDKIKEKLPGHN